MGWQDSLVYRFNALIWIFYAALPALTLMFVWIAAYRGNGGQEIGGMNLPRMLTYYLFVTALSIVITPHPEWEMSTLVRDGKITPFIVRPVGFFGHKVAQETSYQVFKGLLFLPGFLLLLYLFREYISLPVWDFGRICYFLLSACLAYILLTQIKFLMGISAFWLADIGGLMEIGNISLGVFGGRVMPLGILPGWVLAVGNLLPFASLYAFPMQILMAQASSSEMQLGFARQIIWIALLSFAVRFVWQRGLLAYEAYGG